MIGWRRLSRAAMLFGLALGAVPALAQEHVVLAPAAAATGPEAPGLHQAIFAGGCFWGVAGVFAHVRGVTRVVAGYDGGAAATAHYDRIEEGDTGHAESVRVTYDAAKIGYADLLRVFFSVITDPTTLNRQGADTGTQYRSMLIPLEPAQRQMATAYIAQLSAARTWGAPIVTTISPDKGFYPAEAYHQNFMADHPDNGYIAFWDAPKLAAFKRLFPALYVPRAARN